MRHFDLEKPSRKGSELNAADRAYVLSAFVHRATGDHTPQWFKTPMHDGTPYQVQFADDRDWLENTRFQTDIYGALDRGCKSCYSEPTWPDGR